MAQLIQLCGGSGRERLLWAVLLLSGAAVLALRFVVVSPASATNLIIHYGYYATITTIIIAVLCLYRSFQSTKDWWRCHKWGFLAVGVGAVAMQSATPHRFRVLYDEYSLLSVSQQMHLVRHCAVASQAQYFEAEDEIVGFGEYVDKRPPLFSALVSLLHDLTGYRPVNVFALNALVGAVVLAGVYVAGWQIGGAGVGIFGVLLTIGVPVVSQLATSGGFDLLGGAMTILAFVQSIRCVRAPSVANDAALVVMFALATLVRYEALLMGPWIVLMIALGWRRRGRIELSLFLAVSPWLLLLPLLTNLIFVSDGSFLESHGLGIQTFSLHYALANVTSAVRWFLGVDMSYASSPLVGWLGVCAFVMGIRRVWHGPPPREEEWAMLGMGFYALCVLSLLMLFFWGDLADRVQSRLALPLILTLVVAAMWLVARLRKPAWRGIACLVAGLFALLYGFPVCDRLASDERNSIVRQVAWAVEYVQKYTGKDTMIVAESAQPFVCNGRAASSFGIVHRSIEVFAQLHEERVYRRILVVQNLVWNARARDWTGSSYPSSRSPEELELREIASLVVAPGRVTRISEVVGVHAGRGVVHQPARAEPPASMPCVP